MKEFKSGAIRILISSDDFKGMNMQQSGFVINYDCPKSEESYAHKVSKASRFGRTGTAITLINPVDKKDAKFIKKVEKNYEIEIKEMQIDHKEL